MKLFTSCMKCTMQNPSSYVQVGGFIPIQENDLYYFKCVNGHHNLIVIQAFKFEILFESGLCAIRDKYYLESVLSLTASLERFYEFFVKIAMKANGITNETFENIFTSMSKQSERQYGAFICAYGLLYKESPPLLLKNKFIEFRNKVVHKGFLPSEEEVLSYAQEVFNVIKNYYLKILLDYREIVVNCLMENNIKRRIDNKELIDKLGVEISLIAPNFVLSHISDLKDFTTSYEWVKTSVFYG